MHGEVGVANVHKKLASSLALLWFVYLRLIPNPNPYTKANSFSKAKYTPALLQTRSKTAIQGE